LIPRRINSRYCVDVSSQLISIIERRSAYGSNRRRSIVTEDTIAGYSNVISRRSPRKRDRPRGQISGCSKTGGRSRRCDVATTHNRGAGDIRETRLVAGRVYSSHYVTVSSQRGSIRERSTVDCIDGSCSAVPIDAIACDSNIINCRSPRKIDRVRGSIESRRKARWHRWWRRVAHGCGSSFDAVTRER